MRKPISAGNWKMNMTNSQAEKLISDLIPLVKDSKIDVVVCAPYTSLAAAVKATEGTNIKVGSQNIHWEEKGAFTGEISAEMLKEIGVEYAIIGHSERRQYFGETDATVNKRTLAALKAGLIPIVCVGETLEQREQGITEPLVRLQTRAALNGVDADAMKDVVIAYEPVWAIGTGKTATSDDANTVIGWIRSELAAMYGETIANAVRIQYGGSMNPKNAAELMAMPEIDGGLIGGASLKAEDFSMVDNY